LSFKVALAGLVVGVLLSFISAPRPDSPLQVPEQILLGGFAIVLTLASASLTSSARAGLMFALLALLGENVTDLVLFVFWYGADISLLPYAWGFIFFVGRILLFPLAGTLGGYLGQEYFTQHAKGKSLREKSRKRETRVSKSSHY
jgi:hypothetical protein